MDPVNAIITNAPGCLKRLRPRPIWNADNLIPIDARMEILHLMFDVIENTPNEEVEYPHWAVEEDFWYMNIAKAICFDGQNRRALFVIIGACLNAMDYGYCQNFDFERAVTFILGVQHTQSIVEVSPLLLFNRAWFLGQSQITLGMKKTLIAKLFMHQYLAFNDYRNGEGIPYHTELIPPFIVQGSDDSLQTFRAHKVASNTNIHPFQQLSHVVEACLMLNYTITFCWQKKGCQNQVRHQPQTWREFQDHEYTVMSTGNEQHDEMAENEGTPYYHIDTLANPSPTEPTTSSPFKRKGVLRFKRKKKLLSAHQIVKKLTRCSDITLDVQTTTPYNPDLATLILQVNLPDCEPVCNLSLPQIALYNCFICAHRKPLCYMPCCSHTLCKDCCQKLDKCPFCVKSINFEPKEIIFD
nr:ORF114 [Acipenserid herpesvirus 1]